MTKIRATCPTCGEVCLTPGQIDLRTGVEVSTYSFRCPGCDDLIRKPADDRIVQLLANGGVLVRDAAVIPSRHAGGAPFTWDDLIDFHAEMTRPGWYVRLKKAGT